MPMWKSFSVSTAACRSSSVTRITFSSWSSRVTRSRCCQCQSFHWASGTSFQTDRGPGGKRAVTAAGGRGSGAWESSCIIGSVAILDSWASSGAPPLS